MTPRPDDSGVLDAPREVEERVFRLAERATQPPHDAQAARDLADLAESYGAGMVLGHDIAWWRLLADTIDEAKNPPIPPPPPPPQERPMSILDGTHRQPFDRGTVVVSDLERAERIRLTVEARSAALEAAARVYASGRLPGRPPLDLAASFEEWLLRDERDGS